MKTKFITLQQCENDDDLYIVDKLVNCIEPKLGSVLKPHEVKHLCTLRDHKVTLNRYRGD